MLKYFDKMFNIFDIMKNVFNFVTGIPDKVEF